jgi:hypothetical protein
MFKTDVGSDGTPENFWVHPGGKVELTQVVGEELPRLTTHEPGTKQDESSLGVLENVIEPRGA